jgi:hypothetical protein
VEEEGGQLRRGRGYGLYEIVRTGDVSSGTGGARNRRTLTALANRTSKRLASSMRRARGVHLLKMMSQQRFSFV